MKEIKYNLKGYYPTKTARKTNTGGLILGYGGYLNEFHYRFNRRNFLATAFEKLLERVVEHKPMPYYLIRVSNLNT